MLKECYHAVKFPCIGGKPHQSPEKVPVRLCAVTLKVGGGLRFPEDTVFGECFGKPIFFGLADCKDFALLRGELFPQTYKPTVLPAMHDKKSIADRKAALSQSAKKYRTAIDEQLNGLKANAGKIGRNTLVISGVLVVSYLIVRALTKGKKSGKSAATEPERYLPAAPVRRESRIVSMIRQQIALFLIAIAKQKITEVIAQLRKNDPSRS